MFTYRAVGTIGLSCLADTSSVKNKQVTEHCPSAVFSFWNYLHQVKFKLHRIGVFRKKQPPAETYYMSVANYTLHTKSVTKQDVSGFSSNAC